MDGLAYSIEKYSAEIDVKTYINGYRRTDYFIELCQQCKNYGRRYGCPPFDDETLSLVEDYEKVRIMGVKIIPNNKQLPLSAANDLMGACHNKDERRTVGSGEIPWRLCIRICRHLPILR